MQILFVHILMGFFFDSALASNYPNNRHDDMEFYWDDYDVNLIYYDENFENSQLNLRQPDNIAFNNKVFRCHPRENTDAAHQNYVDPRLYGNDKESTTSKCYNFNELYASPPSDYLGPYNSGSDFGPDFLVSHPNMPLRWDANFYFQPESFSHREDTLPIQQFHKNWLQNQPSNSSSKLSLKNAKTNNQPNVQVTLARKLPISKSPIQEALLYCVLLKNSAQFIDDGVLNPKKEVKELVIEVFAFNKLLDCVGLYQSKMAPTDDISSRIKTLRRCWDMPKQRERKEPFVMKAKATYLTTLVRNLRTAQRYQLERSTFNTTI